jgi:predicted PurR-regulated permease PerM
MDRVSDNTNHDTDEDLVAPRSPQSIRRDTDLVRSILIAVAVGALVFMAWKLSHVLLLVFGAILLAVVLSAVAALIARYTPVPERWCLTIATILILGIFIGIFTLFGTQMRGQLTNLAERLPAAVDAFGTRFGIQNLSQELPALVGGGPAANIVGTVAGYGQTLLGALADFVLVVAAGIYMAAEPRLYRRGLVKLFPKAHHDRVEDALTVAGFSLRSWFVAQVISMAMVGTLSGLAYWMIGLPAPLALGLIAGLLDFIPFVGPILGALPAVILAFTLDWTTVLWTVGAVVLIQQIEGNIIMPIVTRRAVDLPPAVALFAVVAFAILFGVPGMLLAVPLAVVTLVLVKKLYVRQTLGEETPVPGEDAAREAEEKGLTSP